MIESLGEKPEVGEVKTSPPEGETFESLEESTQSDATEKESGILNCDGPGTQNASRSATNTSPGDAGDKKFSKIRNNTFLRKICNVVTWTPQRCRWDPDNPPKFNMGLNFLFGFAACFTVANLYYNHPILNVLAKEFDVTYERASLIPTVMQAGYAAGLLLLCPLGDVLRRRAFVLILVFITATLWIVLCVTTSFSAFAAVSFLTAVTTVTPQLMLPLVGDLAPPAKRATSLSIVVSGLLLGMLIARVLSGILTQYTSFRTIYWLSLGLQYFIFGLLWLFMPDYPVTNPGGIAYFSILRSIVSLAFHEPVLVQACLVGLCTASVFTSFWTTLTFLLASPPYSYDSLIIGLFALIGIAAMTIGPFYSKAIIDRFVPLFSVILGELMCLIGVLIGTYIGKFTVAGPVIEAFAIDIGLQTSQIANRSAIYAIAPKARNRVNTAYMVCTFTGQLIGTAVGNRLYAEAGWVASGSANVGFICAALGVCFARAPWQKGWIGWSQGWGIRRRDLGVEAEKGREEEGDTVRETDEEMAMGGEEDGAGEEGKDEGSIGCDDHDGIGETQKEMIPISAPSHIQQ